MKFRILTICLLLCSFFQAVAQQDNVLTKKEIKQGWKLLFNGNNLEGWTSVGKSTAPTEGWKVEDGMITKLKKVRGGDIITAGEYADFEFSADFKITKEANSGIKYFFRKYDEGGWLGLEFQVLDDENHPDAKMGRNGNRLQGTLYDMLPLTSKQNIAIGSWVRAKIVSKGSRVAHYLNGKKVLSFDRKSEAYAEAVKNSKYNKAKPMFGEIGKGHILLQDHGDEVSFKNIKVRELN